MKHIWTGTLGIASLAFPVSLGTAVSEDKSELHRYRAEDGSRIKMQRVAEADGRPVEWNDTTEGYETGTGQVVLLGKEDFDKAYGTKSKHVKIEAFINPSGLPRTAHEVSYYVEPGNGGEVAYALLAQAMLRAGKAAVVSFALRKRDNLGLLYATPDGYLVLERLHWAAEVKTPDFTAPAPLIPADQAAMADTFIETFSGTFAWSTFEDKDAAALDAVIQGKIETGQAIGTPSAPSAVTGPQDIMAALAASVEAAQAARAPVRKRPARKAAA